MTDLDKDLLVGQYARLREAVVWKVDGASEYDVRRPLTPTGTNLLGLVKHLTCCEAGYFGATFGRPLDVSLVLDAADDPDTDMWALPGESRELILCQYESAWRHALETFAGAGLDAPGTVPHWPADRADVTLGQILLHMTIETARHLGHMDILREQIDGSAGRFADLSNLGAADETARRAHVNRVRAAAESFRL
ncbi:DinB family protein [Tsukamurella sp. 8F]|uniref:DinB family protein n=1 Tax=unclassified Tsukamurella TaxID=2633480 RepID=UPI0023B91328|nr:MULTISPECIES: DinB family protein [unclassified Tsukamurella]MDF0531959.1 DinB family protein [Tsukamurella sp. 8J]MDF0587990.1 DinB family protein [Tsukamurella sp. 8F]